MIPVILSPINGKGVASEVYQWDLGQQIVLTGTDVTDCVVQWVYDTLPDGTTTDNRTFSPLTGETGYTEGGIVDIPDAALMQTGEITGYIYYNGKETIGHIVVNPIPRDQPADYVSPDNTVTLQDMIDDTISTDFPNKSVLDDLSDDDGVLLYDGGAIGVTDHNDLSNMDGGTTGEYYHLTGEQHTEVAAMLPNMSIDDALDNTFFGKNSGVAITDGEANTGYGSNALYSNTRGKYNTVTGNYGLALNLTGNYNTVDGVLAGIYIADGETGNTTPDYGVYLGANTKALADNGQNEIVIGYDATGAGSNTATLGNASITKTVLRGDVQIGTKLTDSTGSGAAVGITPSAGDSSTKLATTAYVQGEIAELGASVTVVDDVADLPAGAEGDIGAVISTTYETENYEALTLAANPTHNVTEMKSPAVITADDTWALYVTDDGADFGMPSELGDLSMLINISQSIMYMHNATAVDGIPIGWHMVLTNPFYITNSGGQALVNSVSHGLVNGDTVDISESTYYDGSYTVTRVNNDTYTIGASYIGDDGGVSSVFRNLGDTGFTALPIFNNCLLSVLDETVDLSTIFSSAPNNRDLYVHATDWLKLTYSEHASLKGRNDANSHYATAITTPVYAYNAALIADAVNTHTTDGAVEFVLPVASRSKKITFFLWVKVVGSDAVTFSAAVQWPGGTPHTFSAGVHFVEGTYNPIDSIWALKATAFAEPPA